MALTLTKSVAYALSFAYLKQKFLSEIDRNVRVVLCLFEAKVSKP